MKGLFIPEITAEMFRNGCLESIEALMEEGEIYDIEYPLEREPALKMRPATEQEQEFVNAYIDSISTSIEQGPRKGYLSIDDVMAVFDDFMRGEVDEDGTETFLEMLKDKAETPQEPRKGHWIDGHCSECGCDVPAYVIGWKWQKDMDAKYCPNCGAKMEVSE